VSGTGESLFAASSASAMTGMNWRRVLSFTLLLFAATAGASFPFGFISGFLTAQARPVPGWVTIGTQIAVPLAAIAVFYALARRQEDRPWLHAQAVCLLAWAASFPLNVLLLGQPAIVWAVGLLVMSVAQAAGVGLARLRA
jgi:hypothetical protein